MKTVSLLAFVVLTPLAMLHVDAEPESTAGRSRTKCIPMAAASEFKITVEVGDFAFSAAVYRPCRIPAMV